MTAWGRAQGGGLFPAGGQEDIGASWGMNSCVFAGESAFLAEEAACAEAQYKAGTDCGN